MRLRFAAIKRRRTIRHPRRGGSGVHESDSAVAYDTEYAEDDDDNAPVATESNDANTDSNSNPDDDTSNTSMEAQLSQAPSTSNSFRLALDSINSQMAENNNNTNNNNNNNNSKVNNGIPTVACHSETTTSTSSSSQANI
ncbi:hypothetical protein ACLKA7_011054 [Drosophila subpalustris]